MVIIIYLLQLPIVMRLIVGVRCRCRLKVPGPILVPVGLQVKGVRLAVRMLVYDVFLKGILEIVREKTFYRV